MRGKLPTSILRNAVDRSITIFESVPSFSLIWLHGLGGEAEHYVSFFSHSDSAVYKGCRVKLLQAPLRFTTTNQQENYSWYDIRSLKRFTTPEELVFSFDDIKHSHDTIQQHFEEEMQFWKQVEPESKLSPEKRIYVGGMSQGGVISLHYGLSAKVAPAGVICFSSYALKSTPPHNLGKLPCLLVHGNRDTTIREADARNSYAKLL